MGVNRGNSDFLFCFCSDWFNWIFDIDWILIGFFDLARLFYLAFLRGFVLWKLHEIKFIRSVVLFYVPEIFC